ncbi:erythromycin esterase family protein [Streptosporangium sp. NPDC004379]|uniref:erythromycin esterase family protein n=1 Tax=Streptosporangium sp. NPDC004379 TaxID=3366189 RepID=UPI0036A83F34
MTDRLPANPRAVARPSDGGTALRPGASAIASRALPAAEGTPREEDLLDLVGDARFVLIGEASHGTHEFYEARAHMTRLLIEKRGFCAVAAEADWPDAYRVNRYVHGRSDDLTAEEALRGFERFPTWMWRNAVVLDFVGWLRAHNDRAGRAERARAGFYGLDLYGMYRSIHEVVAFLDRTDPQAAARARERYACFDHYGADDSRAYGFAAAFGAGESCEEQAVEQLADLRAHTLEHVRRDGMLARDEVFYAERNARDVVAAEEYYRTMFGGRVSSWNLRDTHMAETLHALAAHLTRQRGRPARIVVWAHNSHVGDARATEAGEEGEVTLGQLARECFPGECRLIGLTTYTGTVTAAGDWGAPADRMRVRPAFPGTAEELFHRTGRGDFLLDLRAAGEPASGKPPSGEYGAGEPGGGERGAGGPGAGDPAGGLGTPLLERAIGVVYRPRTERRSHYLHARLAGQFDAVIHIDETRAVEPLERTARWERGEAPETYPFAV